ncbi:MAG TPA: tetratricopeptide repeat protein, partial [Sphingomonas sp.]|nr:tetratricopeptide repeat protein [Sphingomonas sp.]
LMQGGLGLPVDPASACDWFERGAGKRGDATHNLALCYERGDGRPRDLARSRVLYQQAGTLGWVQAKCALGNLLILGQGGAVDAPRGVALCREAAETGNANAQADYGIFFLQGKIVPKDMAEARRWLTAAAEQKQANAAYLVAQIHWYGDGTPKDAAVAERWWRVAYDGGRKDAAIHVAQAISEQMPREGERITDLTRFPEWARWLRIAAAEDPDPAKRAKWKEAVESLEKKRD